MNSVLRFFADRRVAYVGPEAKRLNDLVQKWDSCHSCIEELFDDGLTFPNHCMSLYIQQDTRAWRQMEELFCKTKLQGKTKKTIYKKEEYFRKGFWKIIKDNPDLAKLEHEQDKEENKPWEERFHVDESLCLWWLNYYFSEHDPEMQHQVPLYTIEPSYAAIIATAKNLERRMRGNRTEPVLTLPTSETKLVVQAWEECYLMFEWDNLSNAAYMMDLFRQDGWTASDGQHFDWTKAPRKKLNRMFPHARIDTMNTPTNLYGDKNDWFYIHFNWKPEHFSWAQVRKAEKAVREIVFPKLGKFRPSTEPEKYQVVTLTF